jgi:hypothetical protein
MEIYNWVNFNKWTFLTSEGGMSNAEEYDLYSKKGLFHAGSKTSNVKENQNNDSERTQGNRQGSNPRSQGGQSQGS